MHNVLFIKSSSTHHGAKLQQAESPAAISSAGEPLSSRLSPTLYGQKKNRDSVRKLLGH
uniref:Uncharacterized protein n=1 Tax=Peronospora matthiolae TaxID=2874970 RepID=A0AAV1TVH7_9STRA